ncbi:MAG: YgjV family protein [Clostridia bacterium]|nr:YgjV family protein [Clostridia bacterium]
MPGKEPTKIRRVIEAAFDMLWALHYFLLGEPAGCITNVINTVRDFVFFHKDKKWANHRLVPVAFCIVTVVFTAAGGDGLKCLLPMVGSCLAVAGFWCNDAGNIRRFNFPAMLLWLIYGVITGSVPTIIGNSLTLASIVMAEIKLHKSKIA